MRSRWLPVARTWLNCVAHGLRLESPTAIEVVSVPVVGHPAEIDWTAEQVVPLTVKSQQIAAALAALAAAAPATTPIVCVQNGIANEPAALRLFAKVYGVSVACPTSHLQPGVVQAWSTPVTGLLDVGRYPHGSEALPTFTVSRSSGSAPSFAPAASPRVRRRPSSWPPYRPLHPARESPTNGGRAPRTGRYPPG
jgi:Ketopantoate reductase PanE/ApbA